MIITPIDNYFSTGFIMALLGAVFGLITGLSEWDSIPFRITSIGLALVFVVGISILLYYSPMVDAEKQNNLQIEKTNESKIKNMTCSEIQSYLLDSLPDDNQTTQYAHSVFVIKCNGGITK